MPTHQLLFGFSLWGLEGLFNPPESGISRLRESGYHSIEVGAGALVRPEVREAIDAAGLRVVVQCYPLTNDELLPALQLARETNAILVNAHVGTAAMEEREAAALANSMYDASESAGVKLLMETHRARVTQDLLRTVRVCEAVPRMRLTLDVSHYVVCEERPGPTDDLIQRLEPLLDRVEMMHGRVSNGYQIQVDAGNGTNELASRYVSLWSKAMQRWRHRNRAGSAFIFTPELGPPTYAILNAAGEEFSNRWEQSMVLRQMAQRAWDSSKNT